MTATDNRIAGDAVNSVQANKVDNVNYYQSEVQAELFSRTVNEAELTEVRCQFVPSENFADAERIIDRHHVVILRGAGSGRDFAARRLLDDQGCAPVVRLNGQRPMATVRGSELSPGDGYLWNLSDQGVHPFGSAEFNHVTQLIAGTPKCHLVVVLGEASQVPPAATPYCVELRPPDATKVAEGVINQQWDRDHGDPWGVLHDDLADLLRPGTPPERAVQLGELAIRVAKKDIEIVDARTEFSDSFDREVAARMENSWSTMEYTMMFAVAVLQDEPFNEVVALQRKLDDTIRQKELPDDKKFRPRRTFHKPNDQVLDAIGALTELRDSPSRADLPVRTVRFRRRGWSEAVLCRIWEHYHADHEMLLDWLCGRQMSGLYFGASVWALHTLITRVHSRDRVGELDRLAGRGGPANWRLAAATLARLADDERFTDLVAGVVAGWSTGSPHRKCAAITYHAYRFNEFDAQDVLDRLARIGRDPHQSVRDTMVLMTLRMLRRADAFELVLRSVVTWSDDHQPRPGLDGLRAVGLEIGMYLLRMSNDPLGKALDIEPVEQLIVRYPQECRHLLTRLMAEPEYGLTVLATMEDLLDWHPMLGADRRLKQRTADLMAVVRLLAPDLSWWGRQLAVLRVGRRYPRKRSDLRRIFRMARRIERAG